MNKNTVFTTVLVAITLSVIELAGVLVLKARPELEATRQLLMHAAPQVAYLNTASQAYLLYISAPNFVSADGQLQHNADGYRGEMVALR